MSKISKNQSQTRRKAKADSFVWSDDEVILTSDRFNWKHAVRLEISPSTNDNKERRVSAMLDLGI